MPKKAGGWITLGDKLWASMFSYSEHVYPLAFIFVVWCLLAFVKVCISAAVILAMSRPYVPLWRNAQIVFPTGDGFDAEYKAYSFATGEIRFEFRKIADALFHDRKKVSVKDLLKECTADWNQEL